MDKSPTIWAAIMFFVGLGVQVSGLINIKVAYTSWIIGIILFLYAIRRNLPLQRYWGMIPLQVACQKLYYELYKSPKGKYTIDSILKSFRPNEELNVLAGHFAQVINIYGKRPSFTNYEKINEEEFKMGEIKDGGKKLYRYGNYYQKDPEFVELSIRRRDLKKAIKQIRLYFNQ